MKKNIKYYPILILFLIQYTTISAQKVEQIKLIELEVPQALKSNENFSKDKQDSYHIESKFFKEINAFVTVTFNSKNEILRIQIPETVPKNLLKDTSVFKASDPCLDFCGSNTWCLIGCYHFVSKDDKE